MLKFWEFSNFLGNSYFSRSHAWQFAFRRIFSHFWYNFAERNDDDAPENGASELITIYNKKDYGKKERLAKVIL